MSMNKAIHGAVRRDLTRFLDALDTFPDSDRARAEHAAWANFDDQLTRHHQSEHEIAWPALQAVGISRELIAQMDDEHDRMAQALASAGDAIAALRNSAPAADAATAREAVATLKAVAVEHLDHEEAELEPIYVDKRDDPAIKAMGRRFGKVSPPVAGTFFAWVTHGATPEESVAIKSTSPVRCWRSSAASSAGSTAARSRPSGASPTWSYHADGLNDSLA
ncbi:MAG TPA: hemerythrin domain-containing protein [Jiangellaceae bacterium]|nr:hemerythrin domain-containing protein [Jiangellaceae bacterium]